MLLWLFIVAVSASFIGLPNICVCSDAASLAPTSIASCNYRPSMDEPFSSCQVSLKHNVSFSTNDGGQKMICSCAVGFPVTCKALSCFATFSLNKSASWAFVFEEFQPGRIIDAYNQLEYLYGENSQLLIQYRSASGLYATDIRRHSGMPVGNQVLWYGLSPLVEAFSATR